ncbi:hypothetical protein DZ860_01095 [Vibrio sinensis]|uniref:Fimbrial biogenesis outer membrane usher protein n=1 Tax=Vibrio sinensis TaxID=2302434 RepID=A0A3A6R2E9_9VIBR|nr:fimbria/pilus outer membrane usher protein [Vibrio sinensis]RJX75307.1 hypothetical protein DZ860_01095 [Vibrio sinensis]
MAFFLKSSPASITSGTTFSLALCLAMMSLDTVATEMVFPIDVNVANQRVEITAYLDDEREQYWALDGDELLPILALSIDAERLETLRSAMQGRKVTQEDFKQIGWQSHYDASELVISLTVPVTERKIIELPMEQRPSKAPPSHLPLIEPALFSGTLNSYWSHAINLKESRYSLSQVALRGTAAIGHITIEDGHTYSYNHYTNKGKWQRDRTRLMAHLPNRYGFVQFGDYQIETDITALPSGDLYGLSYSYQPEYLEAITRPNIVPLSLDSTSLVRIRVNGEEYRNMRLAAGQYNLLDLPLEQGVNEVEVSYLDQSGIEQKKFYNLIDHPQLLLAGDIETQWVYGAKQIYKDNGDKQIDTDQLGAQGLLSYGLTPWWTISSSLDWQKETQKYNLDHNFALGEFFISLDGLYENNEDSENRYEIFTQFYANDLFNNSLTNFTFGYGVNETFNTKPLAHKLSLSSSIPTPLDNGFLSFNLNHQFDEQGTISQSASINTSYRISNRVSTSLNLRWQKTETAIDRTLYLSISLPLRWNDISVSTRTSYDSRNNDYQTELSASQYRPKYYWRASSKFKDSRYDGFDAFGKWYGDKVIWNGRYSSRNESQTQSSRTLSIGADTGIAWVGDQLTWTSPVSGSFSIVSLPENLQDKYALDYDQYGRIHITSAEQGGHQELLIPIQNDSYRTIKIDSSQLEFNEELQQGEYVAIAGLHTGSSHKLAIRKGYFVSGHFLDKNQLPIANVVGEFQQHSTKKTYPFFTDEQGNFELDIMPEGRYTVHFYDDAAKGTQVNIASNMASDDTFIELGNIVLEPSR